MQNATEKVVPYVVEPAVGVDRLVFAFLYDALREVSSDDGSERRQVLALHRSLAPMCAAALPCPPVAHRSCATAF